MDLPSFRNSCIVKKQIKTAVYPTNIRYLYSIYTQMNMVEFEWTYPLLKTAALLKKTNKNLQFI